MKTLKYLFLTALCATFTFCASTDESDEMEGDNTDDGIIITNNEAEDDALESNLVADGISIAGAQRITATPPAPTGGLSFTLQNTTTAVVGEGFNINLETAQEIAGAYLIIKNTDGSVADSYFDIPEDAFDNDFTKSDKNDSILKNALIEGETSIDLDFDASIPAGEFCYELCVYDDAGNISNPQEVCLTIQAWGGNSGLVGTWDFTSYTESEDGDTDTFEPGSENCDDIEFICNNGDSLDYEECYVINTLRFVFNADGTYTLLQETVDDDLDYDATIETCTVVSDGTSNFTFLSQGQWAYNGSNGRLAIVSFYEEDNEDGDIETFTYPAGEGDLLFDADITLNSNSFTITQDDNDGYIFSISFERS